MEVLRIFGRNCRLLRRVQELPMLELATRAKVSRTTIYKIEQGEGNPRLNTLTEISYSLGVSLSDMFVSVDLDRHTK
ncbi:MAG: transcriptional regulator [Acidobacteria bacterium]|nr:transcriptional regulator [Acidobacteriota bacterium]